VDLELSERIEDGHVIVELRGELDVSTAPELRERLLGTLVGQPGSLILDLSRLRFMDSTGVTVLVATQQRADLRGWTLRLANPQKVVATVLHTTSLDKHFRIYSTVEDAVQAARHNGPPVTTT
jgi:anti-sigma B factor antagonist